jgi:hypothetical protein
MRKGNNNDNSSVKTNLAIVHGSMDFFRYLQEHSRDRFSRFEAYLYMLDKACTNYRPQNIDAKWIPAIGDGQFFITKTELAADWHWHRATVRDFLAKLTEFGCIVIEEHLKGILCTMTRLVVTVNPSVAISSSFEAMVKYAMYSWADGKLSSSQIIRLIGQIERGAKEMLAGSMVSGYTKKQLEDITRLAVHYAIESIIASYPGELRASKKIGCDSSLIDKRAVEFLDGYLDGNWKAFLSPFSSIKQRWHSTSSWSPCTWIVKSGMTSSESWQKRRLVVKVLLKPGMPTATTFRFLSPLLSPQMIFLDL